MTRQCRQVKAGFGLVAVALLLSSQTVAAPQRERISLDRASPSAPAVKALKNVVPSGILEIWRQNVRVTNERIAYQTARVDLNDDGQREAIIQLDHPRTCAAMGSCITYVLTPTPSWRILATFDAETIALTEPDGDTAWRAIWTNGDREKGAQRWSWQNGRYLSREMSAVGTQTGEISNDPGLPEPDDNGTTRAFPSDFESAPTGRVTSRESEATEEANAESREKKTRSPTVSPDTKTVTPAKQERDKSPSTAGDIEWLWR